MAGTFPCPHCGATYPVKPVLIDRPVRCTQCKNVFMLREDGHADKVEAEPAAVGGQSAQQQGGGQAQGSPARSDAAARAAAARARTTAPPPEPPATTPPSAAERAAAARAKTASPPENPFDEADAAAADARSESDSERRRSETARVRTSRLAKQEELRRTMAATLSDAASKALKSESVKRANAEQEREKKKQAGAVGELGPAVLTGYGEAEARNNRAWATGAVLLLVALGALAWMFASSSAERAALKAFTEPDPDWRPPSRIQEQQQRAWIADRAMPIILNLDEAEVTGSRTISLAPLQQVVERALEDHTLLAEQGLYVPAAKRDAAIRILGTLEPGVGAQQALVQKGIAAKPASALPTALVEAGMSERDAELVAWLMEGQTDFRGGNWIRDLILQGQVPRALELAWFTAGDGRRLKLVGQNKYGSDEGIRYRGRLLRFDGWGGPQGEIPDIGAWRVLDVQVASRDGTYPDGRGW